jgi:hypothetical protein
MTGCFPPQPTDVLWDSKALRAFRFEHVVALLQVEDDVRKTPALVAIFAEVQLARAA